MESIVEKPEIDQAPSTLAQFGWFILPPNIVDLLDSQKLGKQGELWLADALDTLCHSERVLVHAIEGTWYTMGDALRYLIANVEYALRNPEVGKKFADYLRTVDLSPFAGSGRDRHVLRDVKVALGCHEPVQKPAPMISK